MLLGYFLIFEFILIAVYLVFRLWKSSFLPLLEQELIIERWSKNFSFEMINRCILLFFISYILPWLFNFDLFKVKNAELNSYTVFMTVLFIGALDFVFYWRHRIYHRWVWVFHRLHHDDRGFDLTLSFRIHPLEVIIQMILILFLGWIFAINEWQLVIAVQVFSIQALLSHLDLLRKDNKVLKIISKVFVTPGFHEKHHDLNQFDSHFGFLFSFWDRIFNTEKRFIVTEKALSSELSERTIWNSLIGKA